MSNVLKQTFVDNNRIMYIPVEIATLDRVNQSLKRPDSTTVNVVPVQETSYQLFLGT